MSSTYPERIKQIRISYPNAYDKWTEFDDALLRQEFTSGVSVSQLSNLLHRQPGAIISRITKLRLITNDKVSNERITEDKINSFDIDFQFHWNGIYCKKGKEYFFPQPISAYMLKNYKHPTIYRWIIYKDSREKVDCTYIGTTKRLCPERLTGYLDPGSSKTNWRLHQEFQQFIKQGYKIGLEYLLVKDVRINDVAIKLNNLRSQTARLFIENLLISYYRQNGLTLLNQ